VIATTQELSAEFPFNQDMNSGNVLGIGALPLLLFFNLYQLIVFWALGSIGWSQSTIGGGTRSSAATAYLTPALSRPNLDVLVNAQVTKLVQTGTKGGKPSFHTVEFAAQAGGTSH
jgi:choline dehydrogenase